MQPGCCVDDVVVVVHALPDAAGQGVEAWLVAEFFRRPGLAGDVFGEESAVGGGHRDQSRAQRRLNANLICLGSRAWRG